MSFARPLQEVPAGALCGEHPEVAATGICDRCGRFLCHDCTREKPRGVFCPPCGARFLSNIDASWSAIAAVILSFASLGCSPLGVVAILFALKDLAFIRMGKAPPGGLKLDLIALGLGAAGLLIGVAILSGWSRAGE